MGRAILAVGIGLVAGNYAYQAFGPGDWSTATERTVFQVVALVLAYSAAALVRLRDANLQ